MITKILITSLLIFLFSSCSESEPAISGKVPEISLQNLGGKKKSVEYQASEYTLLVFWATWCQPCIMEIPVLVKMNKEFGEKELQVVSILTDSPNKELLNKIVTEFKINYEVFLGNENTMRQFGNIASIPTSFVINKEGKILEKISGMIPEYLLREKIKSYLSK